MAAGRAAVALDHERRARARRALEARAPRPVQERVALAPVRPTRSGWPRATRARRGRAPRRRRARALAAPAREVERAERGGRARARRHEQRAPARAIDAHAVELVVRKLEDLESPAARGASRASRWLPPSAKAHSDLVRPTRSRRSTCRAPTAAAPNSAARACRQRSVPAVRRAGGGSTSPSGRRPREAAVRRRTPAGRATRRVRPRPRARAARPVRAEGDQHSVRAEPGQARMVPGEAGDAALVWREARRRHEVEPSHHDDAAPAQQVEGDETVRGLLPPAPCSSSTASRKRPSGEPAKSA